MSHRKHLTFPRGGKCDSGQRRGLLSQCQDGVPGVPGEGAWGSNVSRCPGTTATIGLTLRSGPDTGGRSQLCAAKVKCPLRSQRTQVALRAPWWV